MAVAAGETQSQKMEYEKQGTLLGMSQQRLGAANAARKEATDALVGGIADIGMGAAMGGFGPNALGPGLQKIGGFFKGIFPGKGGGSLPGSGGSGMFGNPQ